jgi:RNA 2',3'-cyclic 3'-phosphodiesterase
MGRLRIRTFIALTLAPTVRRRIRELQSDFAEADAEIKWTEPDNLHVTMLFLGEVDGLELVHVCKAVREIAKNQDAFALEVGGVGCFPNMRRPRTIWVGVREGQDEVVRLHHELEDTLIKLGAYRREDREFTPHITLGRTRGGEVTTALASMLPEHTDWSAGRQVVNEIHVMGSELKNDGPEYTIISREKLRAQGEPVE